MSENLTIKINGVMELADYLEALSMDLSAARPIPLLAIEDLVRLGAERLRRADRLAKHMKDILMAPLARDRQYIHDTAEAALRDWEKS